MTRSFVFMGVSCLALPVYPFYQLISAPLIPFKVSLRLFTPLTKSRSLTDSEVCLACFSCLCDTFTRFSCQRYRTKDQWQTLYGRIQIQKKKILQYHLGKLLIHLLLPGSFHWLIRDGLQRRRVHVWVGRSAQILRNERHDSYSARTSVMHGGLRIPL